MSTVDLFGEQKRRRANYTGSLAIEHVDRCPDCGAPTLASAVAQLALLRHGGYGADRTSVTRRCADADCSWSLVAEVTETRPQR